MTNGEVVAFITSLVFSTDGKLENNLSQALSNYGPDVRQKALKLYIYYKAAVMDQIVADISGSTEQRDSFASLLIQTYNEYINDNQDWFVQNHMQINMSEMVSYMRKFVTAGVYGTKVNHSVDLLLGELGSSVSDAVSVNTKFSFNMSKTYNFLKDSVASKQHGGSGKTAAGSGCLLPIVAAIVIIIVVAAL
jgi:hypothetical protein